MEQHYRLEKVFIGRNGGGNRLIESCGWISQKRISNKLVIYYVKSELQMMKMIFSSQHYSLDLGERPFQLSLTPMVVKGQALDYRYTLSFYKKLDMGKFLRVATDHEFNLYSIYEETQYRKDLDDSLSDYLDFYDEDEIQYFHQAESQLNWNVEH